MKLAWKYHGSLLIGVREITPEIWTIWKLSVDAPVAWPSPAGGGHQRTWCLIDLWAELQQSEATYPFPCPWGVCSAHCSGDRSHVKNTAVRKCCWDPPDWALKAYINFHGFGGRVRKSACSEAKKTILMCKFPCLLKRPPTNLEWPASFNGLSVLCMWGPVSDFLCWTSTVAK